MSIKVPKGLYGVVVSETSIAKSSAEGKLIYRGYSIEELAEKATFLETAYLILYGELPKKEQLEEFNQRLNEYAEPPQAVKRLADFLPQDSHPMDLLRTFISTLGCIHKGAQEELWLAAKMPNLVALSHPETRNNIAKGDNYVQRLFSLLTGHLPSKQEERLFERILIFYLEHDLNASSFTVRVVSSTQADIFSAITAGVAALKGPLHGGANEAVADMIKDIGSEEEGIKLVQSMLNEGKKVPGFGHRIYKKVDPRAQLAKRLYRELAGENDRYYLICSAIESEMWRAKGIPANLDFYAAPVFLKFGIPIPLYTPIFASSRVFGWIAHYNEQKAEGKIIRPDAEYIGPASRRYIPIENR